MSTGANAPPPRKPTIVTLTSASAWPHPHPAARLVVEARRLAVQSAELRRTSLMVMAESRALCRQYRAERAARQSAADERRRGR